MDEQSGHGTSGQAGVLSLHSPSGPESPPDEYQPARESIPLGANEAPTQQLPCVPRAEPKPPKVLGRAVPTRTVVVAEPGPHRHWGLPAFAALLVALTIGVILGQTAANHDSSRFAAAVADLSKPPQNPSATPLPAAAGQRVSAALGKARGLRFDLAGTASLVTIRSVDLGDRLYDIATLDGSAIPKVVNRATGPRLDIARTGATGRVGADVQLNSRVRWTLRLLGGAVEQEVDMRAGGLAGFVSGGAARTVLRLPAPSGTVRITATGGVGQLNIYPAGQSPLRVRLIRGATEAVLDGKARHQVKAGTILDSTGWTSAKNRYDITARAGLSALHVDHQ